ncbi:MAG: hypothetical protein LBP65_00395 [Puniceicoccales bacterium]|jgi:hypothetical protein|nr:hypothetical protein [Puniceicoccales bacterium]
MPWIVRALHWHPVFPVFYNLKIVVQRFFLLNRKSLISRKTMVSPTLTVGQVKEQLAECFQRASEENDFVTKLILCKNSYDRMQLLFRRKGGIPCKALLLASPILLPAMVFCKIIFGDYIKPIAPAICLLLGDKTCGRRSAKENSLRRIRNDAASENPQKKSAALQEMLKILMGLAKAGDAKSLLLVSQTTDRDAKIVLNMALKSQDPFIQELVLQFLQILASNEQLYKDNPIEIAAFLTHQQPLYLFYGPAVTVVQHGTESMKEAIFASLRLLFEHNPTVFAATFQPQIYGIRNSWACMVALVGRMAERKKLLEFLKQLYKHNADSFVEAICCESLRGASLIAWLVVLANADTRGDALEVLELLSKSNLDLFANVMLRCISMTRTNLAMELVLSGDQVVLKTLLKWLQLLQNEGHQNTLIEILEEKSVVFERLIPLLCVRFQCEDPSLADFCNEEEDQVEPEQEAQLEPKIENSVPDGQLFRLLKAVLDLLCLVGREAEDEAVSGLGFALLPGEEKKVDERVWYSFQRRLSRPKTNPPRQIGFVALVNAYCRSAKIPHIADDGAEMGEDNGEELQKVVDHRREMEQLVENLIEILFVIAMHDDRGVLVDILRHDISATCRMLMLAVSNNKSDGKEIQRVIAILQHLAKADPNLLLEILRFWIGCDTLPQLLAMCGTTADRGALLEILQSLAQGIEAENLDVAAEILLGSSGFGINLLEYYRHHDEGDDHKFVPILEQFIADNGIVLAQNPDQDLQNN